MCRYARGVCLAYVRALRCARRTLCVRAGEAPAAPALRPAPAARVARPGATTRIAMIEIVVVVWLLVVVVVIVCC